MKKISAFILVLTAITFAQTAPQKSLTELKSEIKNSTPRQESSLQFANNDLPGKKSTGLAILYSLLLPGMGELYAGNYQSGKYFTIAEVVCWGTYIGFNTYGEWQKDNYKKYAQTNGGVDNSNKDADYYARIGNYKDIYQYNDDKAFDRSFGDMYNQTTYYFKWNTTEERKTYRNMWVSSENAFNNVRFAVGALILNRLASAVNAVRLVAAYNRHLKDEKKVSLYFGAGDGFYSLDGMNLQIHAEL